MTTELCKKGNVSFRNENNSTIIRFYNTDIVELHSDHIVLNTDGFKTVTTKRHINQAMRESDIPISVFQKNYSWFVSFLNSEKPDIPFLDGMTVSRQ